MNNYLEALFNEGEYACVATNPYETAITEVARITEGNCYITLNPIKEGHTRADKNVSSFRNFLVEFDDMDLDRQTEYVKELGMPYTTKVFSGNKSFHYVLSVEGIEDYVEYAKLVSWLYAAVPGADTSCKNPSRFTRIGEGVHKNGEVQDLIDSGNRITKRELIDWLSEKTAMPEDATKKAQRFSGSEFEEIQGTGYRSKLHSATIKFIKTGGRSGFRHRNVFIAACNLRDCYYTLEEAKYLALNKLEQIYTKQNRLEELEIKERAIEDAYSLAPRQQTRG